MLVGGLTITASVEAQAIGDYGSVLFGSPIAAGTTAPTGADQIDELLLTTENSNPTHDGGTVFTDSTNTDGSTGAVPTATLAAFIGADPAVINYNANNPGTEGSAYFYEVTTTGATVLSIDYDFVTSELVGSGDSHPDFGFVTTAQLVDGIETAPAQFALLGSAGDSASKFTTLVDPSGTSPFNLQEGYKALTIPLDSAGTYIFGFGVADANTFDTQSGLFLDDLVVTTVPEPNSTTLLVLAAGGAAAYGAWRRRSIARVIVEG